jgi:hypothetical protein
MPKMLIPTRHSNSFLLPCAPEAQSDLALFTALLGRMHSLVWSAAAICTIRRFKKLKSPDCEKPSFFFHQKDDIAFVCLHGEKFGSEHVVCQIEFYIPRERCIHLSLSLWPSSLVVSGRRMHCGRISLCSLSESIRNVKHVCFLSSLSRPVRERTREKVQSLQQTEFVYT